MANTMRWRYGDTNPVRLPVASDTEIEIGDLVYLEAGEAKPASAQADQGTSLLNLHAFHDAFVGVAMQASPAGQESAIRIATTGVFEFDCDAAAHELGDLLSVGVAPSGDELFDQQVAAGATIDSALGRCAKQQPDATPRVLIDIVSTVARGGPQPVA
ncbi:hypothetical protein [Botrimarina sp.]|uniref:hypothetical protein n=1 Tax=Botrimarina sp. TaxID=2795802 RepID=UPI0032EFB884